jgi:hypothetical protein
MGILKRLFPSKGRETIANQHQTKERIKCPYCGETLEQKPQRKKKCPFCSNTIYVRSGKLVTEKQANEIDKEREEEREKGYIEDLCERFAFSAEEYQKREQELSGKMGGAKPNQVDVVLSLFNEGIVKRKYAKTGIPYYDVALFLNENNKECFHILQQAIKMELKGYQKQEFVTHVGITSSKGCALCEKLDGKIMTVEEALETMPIPNKDCTFHLYDEKRGFCRCSYYPEAKEFIK